MEMQKTKFMTNVKNCCFLLVSKWRLLLGWNIHSGLFFTSQIKAKLIFLLLNDRVKDSVDPIFYKNQWMQRIVVGTYSSRRILVFLSCIYYLFQLLSILNSLLHSLKVNFDLKLWSSFLSWTSLSHFKLDQLYYSALTNSTASLRARERREPDQASATFPSDWTNKL